jgi:hypothetical protein
LSIGSRNFNLRSTIICAAACALVGLPLVAQRDSGSAAPASYPHDMSNYGCAHYDDKTCDQAPAPPPDYNPLVGTWVRFSLLRNGFTVQPPDAPLYVKFTSDGYWNMMEFPAERPKTPKPIEQQTPQELFRRFDALDGGWGNYNTSGMINNRHHLGNLSGGPSGNDHIRGWSFEGNILLLDGTGPTRSPQARFRKLPNQPLGSKALVGAWERTALSINGAAVAQTEPEHLLLGEDGWFQQTVTPGGRTRPRGKQMEQWTTQEYIGAYKGMSAARGTYNVSGNTFARKHIGDADPNLEGRDETGQFTLQGDTMTVQGTDAAGQKFESKYKRMKPWDVYAVPAGRGGAGAQL